MLQEPPMLAYAWPSAITALAPTRVPMIVQRWRRSKRVIRQIVHEAGVGANVGAR